MTSIKEVAVKSERTDAHRVGELVPEHYRFVDVLDLRAGSANDDVASLVKYTMLPHQWHEFCVGQSTRSNGYAIHAVGDRAHLSQCSICGAHIRYAVVWLYLPDGADSIAYITTGEDCAASLGSAQASEIAAQAGALRLFVAGMRKRIRKAEAAVPPELIPLEAAQRWTKVDKLRREWLTLDPRHRRVSSYLHNVVENHSAAGCVGHPQCFHCSLALDLVENGTLSERQVEAVLRGINRPIPSPKLEIPTGVHEVVGKITSVKNGKMLVKCKGYRVWMMIPVELRSRLIRVGDKVRFVAVLEPSSRDPEFLIGSEVRDAALVEV